MDACLASAASTIWTPPTTSRRTPTIPRGAPIYEKRCKEEGFSAYFDYSWQWAYRRKFEEAGLTALLGTGFDPGVTQALLRLRPEAPCSTRSTPSTSWTATAATTAIPLPPTSTRRSTCGRFPRPAPTGRTATGWRSQPMSIKREYDFRPGRPQGYVPAPPRGDRVAGARTSRASSASASS